MPYATTHDNIRIYYESAGSGAPIVFVHEFAGSHRSWEPQLRYFARRYRCLSFSARGYPPSDVPADTSAYSQINAVDDIKVVLEHAGIERAHIVGLSMGGYATLHFGFRYPDSALSLCIGGCGYGSVPGTGGRFKDEAEDLARAIEQAGMEAFTASYAHGPTRLPFERKDPMGFALFKHLLTQLPATGAANTQRGVQKERPSLYELTDQMAALKVPALIICGDADVPCLAPALLMKQHIAGSMLSILPDSGHSINLEEPADYNRIVERFISQVDSGHWPL